MGNNTRIARALCAAAMLTVTGGLAACGGDDTAKAGADAESKPVTLKFAYVAGEKTSFGQLWTWWMDQVEERTGGSVKFERYWDGTLMKGEEMIEGLKTDRVDIAQIQPTAYGAGEFPVTTVAEVPFISANFPAVGRAMSELTAADDSPLRAEWNKKGMEPIAWGIGASGPLFSTDPVTKVEDLKGMRIRAIGRSAQVLKAAGANPITLPISEVYSSVDRGLIKGVYGVPFSFAGPMKFPEVAKHYTEMNVGISSVNALAMSSAGWEKLSDEQREVMREITKGVPAKAAELEPGFDSESCKAIKGAGGTVSVLPEAEVTKLAGLSAQKIEAEWAEGAGKAGIDAEAFIGSYRDAVKQATEDEFADFETAAATCAGE